MDYDNKEKNPFFLPALILALYFPVGFLCKGILGFVEFYIYAFIILLILSIPIFKVNVKSSKVANSILNETPAASQKVDTKLFDELQDAYNSCGDNCEEEYIKILNKHGIVAKINDKDMKLD